MLFPPNASDLLQRIPLSARVVLDVGCGDATWPAVFRSMNPRARLLGIAFDSSSAALAAPHMDQVITTDANAETQGLDLPDGIDCIIYDNSLQYLRDPWAVIRRHADLLGPDGIMLFRVPNIEYWRFADRLLRGTRQRDEVTDPVWQHGFDLDSMREHLVAAGLHICDTTMMRPTGEQPDREAETEAATAFAAGLSGLGIDPETYLKRAAASHMIWRARKQPLQRLVLSGNMLDPVGGVSHVRVVYPMEAIGTDPTIIARVTDQVTLGPKDDGVARIFVLHRPALVDERGHETLRRLTAAGFLIVTEFDDLPDHFDMMRKGGALSFYGAHAVQTSTTAMATAIRPYNPEIAVFPNAVCFLPEVRNFINLPTTTLFFGALNREADWAPLMPALNAVAAIAGDRLRFQVVHDRAFFEALDTPHKAFTPICDHDTYLRLLGESEVSFMPLADTPFSRAKSDLKFIEAASCRTVALASSVVYGDSIQDGRTGLLFRDPRELQAKLIRLVALPELARGMGDAARQYVADERMLAYQVAPRIAWYRSIWARRDSLDAVRRERMQGSRAGYAPPGIE